MYERLGLTTIVFPFTPQAITAMAVGGASWYLFRLAKGPDVIWDRKVRAMLGQHCRCCKLYGSADC